MFWAVWRVIRVSPYARYGPLPATHADDSVFLCDRERCRHGRKHGLLPAAPPARGPRYPCPTCRPATPAPRQARRLPRPAGASRPLRLRRRHGFRRHRRPAAIALCRVEPSQFHKAGCGHRSRAPDPWRNRRISDSNVWAGADWMNRRTGCVAIRKVNSP